MNHCLRGLQWAACVWSRYDSPSLLSNENDPIIPVVAGDGSGMVHIEGRWVPVMA